MIACYGGRDLLYRGKGEVLTERLAPLGVKPEVHVFPSAGHAFLTDGDHPVATVLSWPLMHAGDDPVAAPEARSKIDAFIDQHLPATAAAW